jgi:hypothetical protein
MARRRTHARPICTPDERQQLMDLQAGKCAVCGRDDVELFVDHSYRTGRTRGLLCRQDNAAIGMLKDSPNRLRAALQYLLKPPARQMIS